MVGHGSLISRNREEMWRRRRGEGEKKRARCPFSTVLMYLFLGLVELKKCPKIRLFLFSTPSQTMGITCDFVYIDLDEVDMYQD